MGVVNADDETPTVIFTAVTSGTLLLSVTIDGVPLPDHPVKLLVQRSRSLVHWSIADVGEWAREEGFDEGVVKKMAEAEVDGKVLHQITPEMSLSFSLSFCKKMP